jgi:hypothetical protein
MSEPSTMYFNRYYQRCIMHSWLTVVLISFTRFISRITSSVLLNGRNCFPHIFFFFFTECYSVIPQLHIVQNFSFHFSCISGSTAFAGPWPLLQFRNLFYTVGRTPWTSDESVTRPLPIHRTTKTQIKHAKTSMPWVGFEPAILVFEQG